MRYTAVVTVNDLPEYARWGAKEAAEDACRSVGRSILAITGRENLREEGCRYRAGMLGDVFVAEIQVEVRPEAGAEIETMVRLEVEGWAEEGVRLFREHGLDASSEVEVTATA